MSDRRLNYKLLNILLVLGICFMFYNTIGLWKYVVDKTIAIVSPFVISFAIAYALYPFLVKLQNKGVRKSLALSLIFTCIIGFLIILIKLLIPIISEQISALSGMILSFIADNEESILNPSGSSSSFPAAFRYPFPRPRFPGNGSLLPPDTAGSFLRTS